MITRVSIVAMLLAIAAATIRAQTSPHGKLDIPCQACHSTDSWKMRSDASFDHSKTGFLLDGQHKIANCASCHQKLKFDGASPSCATCHTDVHKSELGSNCIRCHNTQSWKITDMIHRHQLTRFPLLGRHATLDCQSCHASAANYQYKGAPITCYGCHRTDFENTSNPNHKFAGFSTNCETCHKVSSFAWSSGFDHSATSFPLTGAHIMTSCSLCHKSGSFANTPTDCFACHQSQFQSTSQPNHQLAKFDTNCRTCHTTVSWQPSTFSHDNTRFPLTGAHRGVACLDCHVNNQFATLSTNCIDCHRADYAATTNPNHQALGYPQTCTQCHSTVAWNLATFDHNVTKFALTGAHLAVQCQVCHSNSNYQLVYTDCFPCHTSDYQRPQNPNHVTGLLSHQCQSCHTTVAWLPSTFNHGSTRFALTGAHASVQCQTCHTNGNYQLAYTNCYQCHSADFAGATNPNHVSGNFSQNCQTCHTTTAWQPASFDHSTTRFALTGAHTAVQCQTCHTNNNYQLVYTNCYQCHSADFAGATNPNHVAGNFSQNCQTCHTTTAWQPASFDHSTTKFALTGAHVAVQCQTCHTNGNYQLVYTNCYQCHSADFAGAANPNHVAGNFSQNCQTCHTTTAWQPASFDHSTTRFALTGAHLATPCQACHTNGNYQLVYTNCYQCHSADFAGAANPNHVAGNFSQTCQTCHSTTAWQPATFDHSTTKFPLTGAHTTVQCQTCHTNGNYQLVYSGCYSCHATDYAGTTNPNHASSGYPTTCETCHTTTAWTGATFNHTWFPLSHGNSGGVCAKCHTTPANYAVFSCTTAPCHPKSNTDSNHRGVSGYVYNSSNCYSCHPSGRGG